MQAELSEVVRSYIHKSTLRWTITFIGGYMVLIVSFVWQVHDLLTLSHLIIIIKIDNFGSHAIENH